MISVLKYLSLEPSKKYLKLAGPGPSFQKSRVRVQKKWAGSKGLGYPAYPALQYLGLLFMQGAAKNAIFLLFRYLFISKFIIGAAK